MLRYATHFTVNIIFINFDISYIVTLSCVAPEEIKKSIRPSGPWLKNVVHHWHTLNVYLTSFTLHSYSIYQVM